MQAALAAYVVVLAFLALAPIGWQLNRLTVRLYVFFKYDVPIAPWALPEQYGDLLNALLFVPAGALLACTRLRWWGAAIVCVTVSGSVELLQLAVGRDATIRDVVANGVGGLIGALASELAQRARRARRRGGGPGTA